MTNTEFKNILHEALFEQEERVMKRVDEKFRDEIDPLATMINQIYTILDQDVGQRQAELQERAAVNHQLARHQSWIGQLAHSTKTKLQPEL